MGNGIGVWMTSCPEAMGWELWWFLKKRFVEIWTQRRLVDFRIWTRPVQLCATGCAACCWVRWNSQHSKNCVSLSIENLKVKKIIKVSNLNYRESSVFQDSNAYFTYLNISLIRIIAILQILRKNRLILVDMFKLRHVMWWNFFLKSKWRFVVCETDLGLFIALNV